MLQERPPVHPGRILQDHYIEPLGLKINALADNLGVSRKAVSAIINGHKSITTEMALRLSRAFGTTPELWLNLQQNYDLWHTRQRSAEWQSVKPVKQKPPAHSGRRRPAAACAVQEVTFPPG